MDFEISLSTPYLQIIGKKQSKPTFEVLKLSFSIVSVFAIGASILSAACFDLNSLLRLGKRVNPSLVSN